MRTVDILIARLRKKVDSDFAEPLIHTSRAVGYTIHATGVPASPRQSS
jgi:DNA-binding response OmpR family regulator